jgi:hypothetical protein
MKKGAILLLAGLILCCVAFTSAYYLGTAARRELMREPEPELAWLKKEFHLSDAEFARIVQMHEAYLPQCAERCRHIAEQKQQLQELLSKTTTVTPEIQNLLLERARTRAECETEMLKHFLAVSQTMPPEAGRRYLDWVESQSSLSGQGMEQMHHPTDEQHHHHN